MKYLIIYISLLILVVSSYGCVSNEQDEKLIGDPKEVEELTDKDIVEEKFQKLINYCKDNEDIITAVSDEMLEIVSSRGERGITYNNYKEVVDSVENPDYEFLAKTLKLDPPSGTEVEENKVFYFNSAFDNGLYKLGVLYIKEDKVNVEEYLSIRYKSVDRIEKINDCIYVIMEEEMMN